MDLLKAIFIAAVVTGTIALVIGSQGTTAGPMAIESFHLAGKKLYWSWPVFFSGTGLFWGLMVLQR